MKLDNRMEALKSKHATLDEAIQSEARRPQPDSTVLFQLKLQKLRVKDELLRLAV